MSKPKSRRAKPIPGELRGTVAWAGRIEGAILKAIKAHAEVNRRSIGGQINVALDEWLQSFAADGTHKLPQRSSPLAIPAGGSQPPARIQAQAKGKTPTPEVLKQIAESEEGWEGSDPRSLLAGTKVQV